MGSHAKLIYFYRREAKVNLYIILLWQQWGVRGGVRKRKQITWSWHTCCGHNTGRFWCGYHLGSQSGCPFSNIIGVEMPSVFVTWPSKSNRSDALTQVKSWFWSFLSTTSHVIVCRDTNFWQMARQKSLLRRHLSTSLLQKHTHTFFDHCKIKSRDTCPSMQFSTKESHSAAALVLRQRSSKFGLCFSFYKTSG